VASRSEILDQITDISVRVLGCDEEDVAPSTRFSELGSDSLTIVEIGEELGRRFDVYLSDDTIDTMRTVQDAINAVAELSASKKSVPAPKPTVAAAPELAPIPHTSVAAAPLPDRAPVVDRAPPARNPHLKRKTLGLITWMGIIGVLIGGFIGFGLSAMVSASGIDDVSLPPLNPTTSTPTPTEASPTPTPTKKQTGEPTPEPTLTAESRQVDPGERFVLTGAFPVLGEGVELQVQVREKGTGWDDFPITTKTRKDGEFKTELYTSRTGEREFRLLHEKSGKKTPTVKVQIG
jgi:acyl carrier protein